MERFEIWVNRLLMRIAPAWYASQVIRSMPMPDFGTLNPADIRSEEWLSLTSQISHASEYLSQLPGGWQVLAGDLKKLVSGKVLQRHVSINRLNGIQGLKGKALDFPSLRDWAMAQNDLGEPQSADEFDQAVFEFNASEHTPLPLRYREWDGRMYTSAADSLEEIGKLYRYALTHQCDISVRATLTLETVNAKKLEHLRSHYWWFIMHQRSALQIASLLNDCGYPAAAVSNLPGRPDMAYLFASKASRPLNRVILSLMTHNSSTSLMEFGRYLSRHRFSFRNS